MPRQPRKAWRRSGEGNLFTQACRARLLKLVRCLSVLVERTQDEPRGTESGDGVFPRGAGAACSVRLRVGVIDRPEATRDESQPAHAARVVPDLVPVFPDVLFPAAMGAGTRLAPFHPDREAIRMIAPRPAACESRIDGTGINSR